MTKEYQKMLGDLPYRSLEAAEKALKTATMWISAH